MKIVTISDTHTLHDMINVPYGDILIHAGDATLLGYEDEVRKFGKWFRSQPHKYKIFIAGNHDKSFEDTPIKAKQWFFDTKDIDSLNLYTKDNTFYLQEQLVTLTIDGKDITIYGAPHQPEFFNWAFNVPRGEALKQIWDKIPKGIDVLVTHGPAYGLRDKCNHGEKVGCQELKKAISRVRPKLHICGHIHEQYGVEEWAGCLIANSSSCNSRHRPINKPLIFEFKNGKILQK